MPARLSEMAEGYSRLLVKITGSMHGLEIVGIGMSMFCSHVANSERGKIDHVSLVGHVECSANRMQGVKKTSCCV